MTGSAIASSLQSTNVTIATATQGTGGGNGDIFINDNINVSGGTANTTLTFKAERDIIQSSNISVLRTGGHTLNTIYWANSGGNDSGGIILQAGASVATNGGNIWMGGGSGSITWNGLTVGNGYAVANNNTTVYSGDNVGVGLYPGASLTSNGGNIALYGETNLAPITAANILFGVDLDTNSSTAGATINSGTGTILISGISRSNQSGYITEGIGIRNYSKIISANTTANAITITGDASTASTSSTATVGTNIYPSSTIEATGNGGGITITGVSGSVSGNLNFGLYLNSTNILAASGPIILTGTVNAGSVADISGTGTTIGWEASSDITNSSSNITLNADTLSFLTAGTLIQSTGALVIQPRTASTSIGIAGGSGTLSLSAANFSSNFTPGFSSITVGSGTAGAITVGGVTAANDSLTLVSGDAININAALSDAVNKTLTLTGGSTATVSGSGDISATNLLLNGSGANYNLNTAAANSVGTLAATGIAGLNFIDSTALNISTAGLTNGISASGTVSISTTTGNLTISQNVATTNTTSSALVLDAGTSDAVGTTVDNIVLSGSPTATVGGGGRATLYTGSITNSTGVTTLVGSGSGNFRYDSNAGTSNYTAALGAGTYAIYREQPTATVTANATSKTYDGLAYAGNNGVSYVGLFNGDSSSAFTGTPSISGSSQGAVNVGTYTLTLSPSGFSNGLGYGMAYAGGSLTVNTAPLTVTANNASKTYNGLAYSGGNGVTYTGFVNGETSAVLGGTLAYGGTSQGAINAGSYLITPGGYTSGNYAISFTYGALTVNTAPLTVTASNASKTYGQTPTLTAFTSSGLVNSETIGSVTETSAGSAVTAGVSNSPYTITPSAATGGTFSASNYNITYANGSLTVNPLPLSVATVTNANKVYDGTTNAAANLLTVSNVINGDSVSLSGNATLAGSGVGNEALSSVGNLTVNNPNYTVTGGTASGSVVVTPQESVMANAIIQVQPTNNAPPPSATPIAVVTQTGQPASAGQVSSFVNVVTPLPQLSVTFGGGSQLTIISSPSANEPTQVVSLSQARGMMQPVINSGGSPGDVSGVPQGGGDVVVDVRVPVSRNSLAEIEIVNGGVRLPTGLEQELFVVKAQ